MTTSDKKKYTFLIVTEGSDGDNRPPIAVGKYLMSADHFVRAAVPQDFIQFYEKNRIPALLMGNSSRDFFRTHANTMYDRNIDGFKTMFSLFTKAVEKQFQIILSEAEKADAIIASGFIFAAPTVAEYYKIPMVHTVHAPVYFPSRFIPPANIRKQHLPWWLNCIAIMGCFVHGLDADDPGCFERTLDFVMTSGIDLPRFTCCTPFPGTPFFQRLKKEGRIITQNWSLYDAQHVVFKPLGMSIEELRHGHHWIWKEAYKTKNMIKRLTKSRAFLRYSIPANIGYKVYANSLEKYTDEFMEQDHLALSSSAIQTH